MTGAAQKMEENLERARAEVAAWKEILGSAVKAEREGSFSHDLKDKDVWEERFLPSRSECFARR